MTDHARISPTKVSDSLKVAAFDLSPEPALVVDREGALVAVNEAAEALFGQGLSLLARGRFRAALPPGSVLVSMMDRALFEGALVREHGVEVNLFGQPPFEADGAAAPLGDGSVLLTLHVKGVLGVERASDAAGLRSVVGLGRMLAHEIKNPLAGIRGAAQLLKTGASAADQPLAQLIVDETDRIRRLVDRMEAFSDEVPGPREAVNIHQVLDRVRALVVNGVADGLALQRALRPLAARRLGRRGPPDPGVPEPGEERRRGRPLRGDGQGILSIHTAWRPGVRVRGADGKAAAGAPIEIRVQDNGPGVPEACATTCSSRSSPPRPTARAWAWPWSPSW
jgi:two-component system nitrogen regulation sensor histidine kinase GlnL